MATTHFDASARSNLNSTVKAAKSATVRIRRHSLPDFEGRLGEGQIRLLTARLAQLRLAPAGPRSCPRDYGDVDEVTLKMPAHVVRIWVQVNGCRLVTTRPTIVGIREDFDLVLDQMLLREIAAPVKYARPDN